MSRTLLIRGARQLLTLRGPSGPRRGPAMQELAIIPDGTLLIRDGLIEDVGPARRVENLAAARHAEEISAAGRVVMPAFVDSYAHLVCAPMEWDGLLETPGPGALRERVLAAASGLRKVSSKSLGARAQALLCGMARHGTGSVEAKSGYGLDFTGELKTLRVHAALDKNPIDVVSTFFGANTPPAEYSDNPQAHLEYLCTRVLPVVGRRRLARFVDIRCDDGGFTATEARQYLTAARELGFGIKITAGQFRELGAAELALEFQATAVSHLVHAGDHSIALLAHSSAVATLLPAVALQAAAERFPRARAFLDRGVAVALASGFDPASRGTYNMQTVLAIACRFLKMTPAEAISAATINGAHAMRHAHRTGSLEPGKDADVLLMNARDYRELTMQMGVNQVQMALHRGEVIYREGEVAL